MPVEHNTNSMFCIYNFSFVFRANNHLQFGDDVNGENSVTAARIVVHAIRRNHMNNLQSLRQMCTSESNFITRDCQRLDSSFLPQELPTDRQTPE